MNDLLQKHGCSNVFAVPEGLKELMADISREVLRDQPTKIFDFIANYLSVLIITREHGILAMKILEDLCDCKPSVSEHLLQLGMEKEQADMLSQVIKNEIEGFEPVEGNEKVKESHIINKILTRSVLDEDMTARVCQVARNAYRDYWYRKKLLEQSMKVQPDEPWEIAAQRTLELYKKTKPSFTELTRATQKIQAAYRGYHVRKNLLNHLKPKPKTMRPKVDILGPPVDVAESREIDLGPIIDIKVRDEDVSTMFDEYTNEKLCLHYDPMKTLTHVEDDSFLTEHTRSSRLLTQLPASTKSMTAADTKSSQSRQPSNSEVHSRQISQIVDVGRLSRLTSGVPDAVTQHDTSIQKISFVEAPPEVIPDKDIEATPAEAEEERALTGSQEAQESNIPEAHESEVQEVQESEVQEVQESEVQEVQESEVQELQEATVVKPAEAVQSEATDATDAEGAQEIPEDIIDDQTEGDGVSAPTISVPSSAPETTNNTDVEDAGDFQDTTGDEEEGE